MAKFYIFLKKQQRYLPFTLFSRYKKHIIGIDRLDKAYPLVGLSSDPAEKFRHIFWVLYSCFGSLITYGSTISKAVREIWLPTWYRPPHRSPKS